MNTRKNVTALLAALLVALAFSACPSPADGGSSTPIAASTPCLCPPVMEMVRIRAGTFTMGSPSSEADSYDNERLPHTVTLSAFWMGKYEVTQAQYLAVMGTNPSSSFGVGNNYPVYYVSWYDAIVFCNKLSMKEGLSPAYSISNSTDPDDWGTVPWGNNAAWDAVQIVYGSNGYRLPTEAQWEYACRAGKQTPWHTASGTDSDLGNYAWYSPNSSSMAHEVGLKSPNAFGLYDMHGNVWEWCWDRYGAYDNGTQTDPTGAASGTYRVDRGGSWDSAGQSLRSARRDNGGPSNSSNRVGFRLVRPN